jgi:methylmalonyl-CoA/ethylmalonyl-CoA epimerase
MVNNPSGKSTFSNLCHVSIVVKDIRKKIKILENLGIGPFKQEFLPSGSPGMSYRGKLMASNFLEFRGRIGNLELELFEPDDKPSPWKEFLDARGEGIHHLAFSVEDVDKVLEGMMRQGAEVLLTAGPHGKLGAVYVDLKVCNLIVELVKNEIAARIEMPEPVLDEKSRKTLAQNPFYRLEHVGVVVRNVHEAAKRLSSLGTAPFEDKLAKQPSHKARLEEYRANLGNIALDLLQPVEGKSPWQEYLESKGEGFHHIGFQVDDLNRAAEYLTQKGAKTIFRGKWEGGAGGVFDLGIPNVSIDMIEGGI